MSIRIFFPAPTSALMVLPVPADRDGVLRVLTAERELLELPGVRSTVPVYNKLLVEGSPESWDENEMRARLMRAGENALAGVPPEPEVEPVELPVCYDPELGPDLEEVARRAGMTTTEVIELHSASTYTVMATGFAPGFAYLGEIDARLAAPRRSSPRIRVPQGTLGIADRRTGVYPVDGPGGWRLLGRVPPSLFADVHRRVRRFSPGGLVRFRPISRKAYGEMEKCEERAETDAASGGETSDAAGRTAVSVVDQAPHLVVERTGPLATVQDPGRIGGRRLGFGPGGAMDQSSCLWANRLLNNAPHDALIEVSIGGLALRFRTGMVIALAGADLSTTLDGAPVAPWRTTKVEAGQRLHFGYAPDGMRAYVAFPGGLSAARVYGSASTVLREGLDGLLGHPLRPGDELRSLDPARKLPRRRLPAAAVPDHLRRSGTGDAVQPKGDGARAPALTLPLVTGFEWHEFEASDRARFLASDWKIDPASGRTAIRLAGPTLASGPKVLDSTPVVDGTVQVTGDGQPLVFMRDRPTAGGYAKLGAVVADALDALAQARPGAVARFVLADPAEARRAMVEREAFFGIGAGRDRLS